MKHFETSVESGESHVCIVCRCAPILFSSKLVSKQHKTVFTSERAAENLMLITEVKVQLKLFMW